MTARRTRNWRRWSSTLLIHQLAFVVGQARFAVQRYDGHAQGDREENHRHQVSECAYSATGIGRGNSRRPAARRLGADRQAAAIRIRPSSGAVGKAAGMTGKLRLDSGAGSI